MNAYIFSATLLQREVKARGTLQQTLHSRNLEMCTNAIICAPDSEKAQAVFEDWCTGEPDEQESRGQKEITGIVGAQFVEQMLTENGEHPLDWGAVSQKCQEPLPADDFEQGYWVDVNQVLSDECSAQNGNGERIPRTKDGLPSSVESLKSGLPEDIRSGLNWSADKTFLFVVSALQPLSRAETEGPESGMQDEATRPEEGQGQDKHIAPAPMDPSVLQRMQQSDEESRGEETTEIDPPISVLEDSRLPRLPEMREKEAAALVEARNSVVAGWLWRKFAATTPLATNEIYVQQCPNPIVAEAP